MLPLSHTNRIRLVCSLYLFSLVLLIAFSCGKSKDLEGKNDQNGNTSSEADRTITKPDENDGEWKFLFDGKTTAGWRGINQDFFPGEGWKVEDGTLVVNATDGKESGNGGDIITIEQFGDFVLEWEWKMLSKGGNSGVKYFVKEGLSNNEKYGAGLEYQILDDENFSWMLEGKMQPGDYRTLASLYEIYPPENRKANPVGEWNHSRIVSQSMHVEHWLNDVKVLEYKRGSDDFRERVAKSKFARYEDFGEAPEGHILLQDHGSKIAFRNIRIKETSQKLPLSD